MNNKWDNIQDLTSYRVVSNNGNGFIGQLISSDNKIISILGMDQDFIGFSYNREQTETITKKNYEEALKIKNQ